MKQNESIEHVLENMDKNVVYKTKSSRLSAYLFAALGVVLLVVYSSFEWKSTDYLPHLLFVVGSVSFVCGILLFFFRKSFFLCVKSHQRLVDYQLCFQMSEQDKLVKSVETGNLQLLKDLKPSISNGLRLRVLATKDGQVCFSQVIAYVSNEYVEITEVTSHSVDDANLLMALLDRKKN